MTNSGKRDDPDQEYYDEEDDDSPASISFTKTEKVERRLPGFLKESAAKAIAELGSKPSKGLFE